jgi:hypothetical protein
LFRHPYGALGPFVSGSHLGGDCRPRVRLDVRWLRRQMRKLSRHATHLLPTRPQRFPEWHADILRAATRTPLGGP